MQTPTLRNFTHSTRLLATATAVSLIGALATLCGTASAQSGAFNFISAPRLHPPIIHNDRPVLHKQLAGGDFLLSSFLNPTAGKPLVGQSGPLLLGQNLQPLWFYPVPSGKSATDLTAQRYHGQSVLSWWQGNITATGATTSGTDEVVNQHYKFVATLNGEQGWVLSPHEFLVRGNDAWVTANRNVAADLSRYGGAYNGALIDSARNISSIWKIIVARFSNTIVTNGPMPHIWLMLMAVAWNRPIRRTKPPLGGDVPDMGTPWASGVFREAG